MGKIQLLTQERNDDPEEDASDRQQYPPRRIGVYWWLGTGHAVARIRRTWLRCHVFDEAAGCRAGRLGRVTMLLHKVSLKCAKPVPSFIRA